ncbi:MAG: hypothetical protein R6V05_07510, partial [Candidatus Brocadiia bacterium]
HHSFDEQFTQIPNHWLRDSRLSLKAIGLLAQIMSHTPGWNMSIRSLARNNDCGTELIKSAIEELEEYGYLKRSDQKHDERGRFVDFDYITQDPTPSENTVTEKPRNGEMGHKEYHSLKEEQLIKNKQENPQLENFLEEFLYVYPKKGEAKKPIRQKLEKALKVASFEEILEGAKRYAEFLEWSDQYVAMAKTWLYQERWTEEHPPNPETVKKENYQKSMAVEYEYTQRQLAEMKEAESKAAPPPKCEHEKTLALCPICVKDL